MPCGVAPGALPAGESAATLAARPIVATAASKAAQPIALVCPTTPVISFNAGRSVA